jgi:hypothetical protein
MSGTSYDSECPMCGSRMMSCSETRPYDMCDHECLECGFVAYTKETRMGLEELNERRKDMGMKPRKTLKRQVNK